MQFSYLATPCSQPHFLGVSQTWASPLTPLWLTATYVSTFLEVTACQSSPDRGNDMTYQLTVCLQHTQTRLYACTPTPTTPMHAHTHPQPTHTCTHARAHTHMHTRIPFTHTHMHARTHIPLARAHTHTHTHTPHACANTHTPHAHALRAL